MTAPSDPGLQAERTQLAWSRTALGIAANAVLLATHEVRQAGSALGYLPAALALLVAVTTFFYGRRRAGYLRREVWPRPLAPTQAVPVLGWSVVALAALSGIVLVLA